MIYFTSDTHFRHTNIIKYCNRPFNSTDEMDEALIYNWNAKVQPGDTIYHIGDFGWGKKEALMKIFKRLNGNKILIKGNHDGEVLKLPWASVHDMLEVKVDGKYYQLCHYPMRSWDKSFHGSRSLHGHTHGTLGPHGWSCDAGVDCWGFSPVSTKQLDDLFEKLPRDSEGQRMPKGVIWNADRHMQYGFSDFFIGDGSMDNIDPESLYKKGEE